MMLVHFNNVVVVYPTTDACMCFNLRVCMLLYLRSVQLVHTARHEWTNDTRVWNFSSIFFFRISHSEGRAKKRTNIESLSFVAFVYIKIHFMCDYIIIELEHNISPHGINMNSNQIIMCKHCVCALLFRFNYDS